MCERASAESAIHSGRFFGPSLAPCRVESRFRRSFTMRSESWGDAPGWYQTAPLALTKRGC